MSENKLHLADRAIKRAEELERTLRSLVEGESDGNGALICRALVGWGISELPSDWRERACGECKVCQARKVLGTFPSQELGFERLDAFWPCPVCGEIDPQCIGDEVNAEGYYVLRYTSPACQHEWTVRPRDLPLVRYYTRLAPSRPSATEEEGQ